MFKHTRSLVASATLVASLGADTLAIDPIVVTATKTEQSLQDVTSNINIITAVELEEKHVATVADALNLISGISTISNGGLGKSTSVFVRGLDTSRVLVLIDGIRYNDPSNSSTGSAFEHLIITDIEQIEFIKGAQSGIWGADAGAGVINIITKSAKKGLHGSINGEYGSFNTKKYGVSASYATDAYYFKVNSNIVETDGFTAAAPKGVDINTLEDDGYKNATTSLRLGFKITETNKIDISHTVINAQNEGDRSSSTPNSIYNSVIHDKLSSVNFNHIDSFNELNIYAKSSTFERDYPQSTSTKKYDGVSKEYGLTSRIPYNNQKDFVILGADFKSFEHLNALNKKYTDKGLSITNNNTFNDRTIITESLRTDDYDTFNDKTTGKIGVKHNLNKDLYLSSNYGTGYNVPTAYQLFDTTYGYSNLTPESTRSYDVSLGYKSVTLTYFYNTTDNMIDFDKGTWKYTNVNGISTFRGIEAEYKNRILADTLLTVNYTQLSAKDKDGFDLERRAKENLKVGIDYYGIEKFHFGVFGEYVGKRIQYTYGTHNISAQTGSYTLANAVINYDLSKTVRIYGKLDNITDKYYQTIDGYVTSPRAFYAGMKASF
ncbi:MAG TPA: TonB-dependent receptor [Sulfuricurvum sp.]|nr:TonB-dependent receptor [Sulfuricurvum sp.]